MIRNFSDFCAELGRAGFSGAIGGLDDGVFGLLRSGGDARQDINWHSGDPETDPWEWRMRVLDERDDIAYAKVFFRKAGYITRRWYPYFLAARRGVRSFEEAYADGLYSHHAKRIWNALSARGALSAPALKSLAGFRREDKERFDKALTDLQMGLYVTIRGHERKLGETGAEYGWAAMTYCLTEDFWELEVFNSAAAISRERAVSAISARVRELNPNANEKKLAAFIHAAPPAAAPYQLERQ
jgi:hypothetical protein